MTDQVLDVARALVPQLAQNAAEVEMNGSIDAAVLKRLDRVGMFSMLRNVAHGGQEANLADFFHAVRILSRGCMSTGWVCSLFASHEWHMSLFDDRVQDEIRAGGPGTFVASSYAPEGQLVAVDGGYRLSGRWRTLTGVGFASWVFLGALLLDGEGEPVDFLTVLVPADEITIEQRWDPTGLRGVGADGVSLRDVFVPGYRAFGSRGRMEQQDPTNERLSPLYRVPYAMVHTHAAAIPLIGGAEGAYDALIADLPEAASLPKVAQALTDVEASWLQVIRNTEDLLEHARSGAPLDVHLALRSRRDQVLAAERSARAIGVFLDAAGDEALARRHPLQRAWRDAQVAMTNAANAVDETVSIYGRWAYGIDVADRWW